MFSSGFSEAKNMTNSDGQPSSRRSSMRVKGDEEEDSDMESVDSDDLMAMYDSASEGDEEEYQDGEDGNFTTQEVTRIDEEKEDGLTASEDEDDDIGDAENQTAHTSINEDPEEDLDSASSMLFSPTVASVKPNSRSDIMKVDTPVLGTSMLPASPSRRYPTRFSLTGSLSDTAAEEAGTSTMRSVSTNIHATPVQNTSPRSQRYQKRVETKTVVQKTRDNPSPSKSRKECVTGVVKDAR